MFCARSEVNQPRENRLFGGLIWFVLYMGSIDLFAHSPLDIVVQENCN